MSQTPNRTAVLPLSGLALLALTLASTPAQAPVKSQAAYMMKEKTRQAQTDTRRKEFDEKQYEKANTPSLEDQRQQQHREELRRSLNNPPLTEIWSAKALNDLLDHLAKLQSKRGTTIALDAEQLKRINVTSGKGSSNMALLKSGGRLDWPVALQTLPPRTESRDLRQQLETELPKAVLQAASGRADALALQKMNRCVDQLEQLLVGQVSELSCSQYMDAKRYLGQLRDALKLLEQPDARNYLNGTYAARGKSVDELIRNLTKDGLRFAPAVAGEESAYTALHRALVNYDLSIDHAH